MPNYRSRYVFRTELIIHLLLGLPMKARKFVSSRVLGTYGFTSFPKDLPAPGIDPRTSRLQCECVDHYAMEADIAFIL